MTVLRLLASAVIIHCISVCYAANYYPSLITDSTGTHSTQQPITCLSVKDQSGTNDNWNKYIEFNAASVIYSGVFTFNNIAESSVASATLTVNFRGQAYQFQGWKFELFLNPVGATPGQWVLIGDTNPNTVGWGSWSLLAFNVPSSVDFTRVISPQHAVQIRYSATKAYDASQLDYVQIALTAGAAVTASATTTVATTAAATTAKATTASASTSAAATTSTATTAAATTAKATTSSASTSAAATTAAAASTSSASGTATSTTGSGSLNGVHFNLRILVLSASSAASGGLDFVNLTLDSVGMQYDLAVITSSSSLATLLSTTGVGKYAGIISIQKTLLSATQQQAIINYQLKYGVKWAVIGSNPSGLPGLTAGSATTTKGTLTIAPEFSSYAHPLKQTMSIDTQKSIAWSDQAAASITPATISNAAVATPAVLYNGNKVAIAECKFPDGTRQLHYFIAQNVAYFHSRILGVLLLNWIAPAGVFIGHRQVTLAVQPDDLFMASFLWDTRTHSNPLSQSLTYRLTPADLQSAADFVTSINPTLPAGSYVTLEWPFNGAGTTWYTQPDPLLLKAIELQNKFYFVSHTWDHPCDFDTATYDSVYGELFNNTKFTPSFLTGGVNSPLFTKNALVNPCITGLRNGNCLRAMADNGINLAVGDNSVDAYVPKNKYHGITTTVANNGYAGIFIIPREAYDIDYDNSIPAEVVDQFNTDNGLSWNFEKILQLNVDYAMEKKSAFRHDAFMFHQANVRFFSYNDPQTGTTRSVSLTTLWMERLIKAILSYYDLPIVSPKFDKMAAIWQQREAMDNCGFNADLEISNGKLVGITATSTKNCVVPLTGLSLNGANARVETSGTETVSFVTMVANQAQYLSLSTPISL